MTFDKATVDNEKKSIQDKFAELDKKEAILIDQRKGIDQDLSKLTTEKVRLQGEYRLLERFGKEDKKPEKKEIKN